MKKNLWKVGLLFLGALVLTGCTASFTTVQDKANMLAHYESTIVKYKEKDVTNIEAIVEEVNDAGYTAPSEDFFDYIEAKVATEVKVSYATTRLTINGEEKSYNDLSLETLLEDILFNSFNRESYFLLTSNIIFLYSSILSDATFFLFFTNSYAV